MRGELDTVEARIRTINRSAQILRAEKADVPIAELLDRGAFDLGRILEMEPNFLSGDDEHEHDDAVTSVSLTSNMPIDPDLFDEWIGSVLAAHGQDLLRTKGILLPRQRRALRVSGKRRWGAKIRARGIYRDPVRSSHGHFVKASGLRWLCIMLLPEIGWAGRVWALPFLTALAASEHHAREHGRRHKKLTGWVRQVLLQTARWLPDRRIVGVADSSFAVIDLLNAVRPRICMVTRLRLDAHLFDPPPPRRLGWAATDNRSTLAHAGQPCPCP